MNRLFQEGFCDKVVICDADKERLKTIGDINKIAPENRFTDITEMLKKEDLSGAVLAIPTAIHKKIALQVLEHCDILCEKPLAPTVKECNEIAAKAEKEDKIIQVGHLERYNPVVVTLKSFLEEQETEDKIMHITGRRIGPGPTRLDSKDLDPNYFGCGHDFMVHDIDVVNGLLNKIPRRVTATSCYIDGFPYEVELFAVFEYEGFNEQNDPVLFDCRATWRAFPNLKRRKLIVQTTKETMTLDFILQSIIREQGLAQHSLSQSFSEYLGAYRANEITNHYLAAGPDQEPLYLQDKDFLACIDSRKKPMVSEKEGTDAVKCIVAAISAAKTGSAVEIK
jgi:UDP-N-acetylglucosamine 3-dehydrogenase